MRVLAIFAGVFCAFFGHETVGKAGDWPQILGPARNGVAAADERLAEHWPADGPKVRWTHAVGTGYAGVAVAAGKTIVFHRQGGQEVVEALDAASGKLLWRAQSETGYVSSIDRDDGPRASPVVHKDRVYVFGAEGGLTCLALDSGKQIWRRELGKDYPLPDSYFGAGSTPIVEADKLFVNLGGRGGAGLVAVRLADGKTVWKATDEAASYSSPVAATIDGVRHVIFVTRYNVVSIDPEKGDVRFRIPFGKRGPTVNAAMPLICDGNLFVTSSYGIGAVMSKIAKNDAKRLWDGVDIMSSQYTSSVYADGLLVGCDGRADQPPGNLRCVEAKTGKVLWSEEGFGVAHLVRADNKLLALKDDGTLVLGKASARGFESIATARVLRGTTRALPALSGGLLYVRDTDTLKCLEVGSTGPGAK